MIKARPKMLTFLVLFVKLSSAVRAFTTYTQSSRTSASSAYRTTTSYLASCLSP